MVEGSLRILMVISQYRPTVGGAERQAERLACELARRGHCVEVLTRPVTGQPPEEERDGVRISRTLRAVSAGKLWGLSYLLTAFWEIWKRRRRFDVVHLHQLYLHAVSAVLARWLGGPPVIVKVVNSGLFGDWILLRKMTGGGLWMRLALQVDRVVAICRRLEPELRAEGFSDEQVEYIPNGVDIEMFRPQPAGEIEPGRLLFLGRFDPYKGLHDLIQAAEILRGREVPFHLHIVGEGPLHRDLARQVALAGLDRQVRFRPVVRDVVHEYARTALVVLPSIAEGMSNVQLEAMACGRPVVSSRVGGADDLLAPAEPIGPVLEGNAIRETGAGILVEPSRPMALAAAIERVLSDSDRVAAMGSAARDIVEQGFSILAIADRYEALYRGLIARRRRK